MKTRGTWILLAAVVVMGAVLYVTERGNLTTEDRRERARLALRVDTEHVLLLHLSRGAGEGIRLRRDGTDWVLVEPVRGPADEGVVERLLAELRDLPRHAVITAREQRQKGWSLQQYGLEHPRAAITLGYANRERTLLVGRKAAVGERYYVKYEDQADVVVTDARVLELVPASPDELRERTLFSFEPAEVAKVEIQRDEGFLQLIRQDETTWRLLQPVVARADRAAADGLVERLLGHRIEAFVKEEIADASSYGISGERSVALRADASGEPETVLLGERFGEDPERIYGRHEGRPTLYGLSTGLLADVAIDIEDLRDRQVLPLAAYEVGSLRIAEGEKDIHLQREGGAWMLTSPTRRPADADRVAEVLRGWAQVSAESFVDGVGTNLSAHGLVPPYRRVQFGRARPAREAEQEPELELLFSAGEHEGYQLARPSGESYLVRVQEDLSALAPLDPLFYWDRTLHRLALDDVRSVAVETAARTQAVRRVEEGWEPVDASPRAVPDPDAVRDLLQVSMALEVVAYVDAAPADLEVFGLGNPTGKLVLGLTGEQGIEKTILLGRSAGEDTVYGMVQGSEVVFTLPVAWRRILERPLYLATP